MSGAALLALHDVDRIEFSALRCKVRPAGLSLHTSDRNAQDQEPQGIAPPALLSGDFGLLKFNVDLRALPRQFLAVVIRIKHRIDLDFLDRLGLHFAAEQRETGQHNPSHLNLPTESAMVPSVFCSVNQTAVHR